MSMLSAQCDELRSMAASVGLAVPQAATLMMGAADAIDRLDAENDRLRKQGARLFDKTLELGTENARLREFMSDILAYGYHGGFLCADGAWSCPHYQECFNCPVEEGPEKYVRRGCRWLALARELGVVTSE